MPRLLVEGKEGEAARADHPLSQPCFRPGRPLSAACSQPAHNSNRQQAAPPESVDSWAELWRAAGQSMLSFAFLAPPSLRRRPGYIAVWKGFVGIFLSVDRDHYAAGSSVGRFVAWAVSLCGGVVVCVVSVVCSLQLLLAKLLSETWPPVVWCVRGLCCVHVDTSWFFPHPTTHPSGRVNYYCCYTCRPQPTHHHQPTNQPTNQPTATARRRQVLSQLTFRVDFPRQIALLDFHSASPLWQHDLRNCHLFQPPTFEEETV